jgi:transcriptional regulator with XRE-family HTH domain
MADRKPKTDEFTRTFARHLRELREERGWTQKALVEQIGVVREMIANYERGFHHPPLPTLQKLARAFGVTVDYLFTGRPPAREDFQDGELLEFFLQVDKLDFRARHTLKEMILALLARHQMEHKPGRRGQAA